MRRRLRLAGVLAFLLTLVAVPVEAGQGGGIVGKGTFVFPAGTVTCVPFGDVGFVVCGTSGTVDYHLRFTPSSNENSWFKVEDFTGTVTEICPTYPVCRSMSFTGDSAMLLVHLGPERPNFILANHPSAELPHRVFTTGAGDITAPTITDARMVNNLGSTDFVESGDSFTLTFSETMSGVTTGNIRVRDQDGTSAQVTCGAVAGPSQATCSWNATVTTVTVTLTGPVGMIDVGGVPGVQIPFNITALTGFSDLQGNLPNLGSGDPVVGE